MALAPLPPNDGSAARVQQALQENHEPAAAAAAAAVLQVRWWPSPMARSPLQRRQ